MGDMTPQAVGRFRGDLRAHLLTNKETFKDKVLRAGFHKDLTHGWLLEALTRADDLLWGRWDYWMQCMMEQDLPEEPIPEIMFLDQYDKRVWRMLERALDSIPNHGSFRGWSSSTYFRYFLEWLLFGLGHHGHPTAPEEPMGCDGASDRLYQMVDLGQMILLPYDYLGDMAAEMGYNRSLGFFPTPMGICRLMTDMTMILGPDDPPADQRRMTVCDPCVGTGRLLLLASNHSMRLYGQDISLEMCHCSVINGYLYAPWLAKPLPFLDRVPPSHMGPVSDSIAARHQDPCHKARTVHDAAAQPGCWPIGIRTLADEDDLVPAR